MRRNLRSLFTEPNRFLQKALRKELRDQGHRNTGALESSFTSEVVTNGEDVTLQGYALNYADILNEGVKPERASFKQFPFMVRYFLSKGYDERTAKGYAAATIKKWQEEGMSTKASLRFSKNGKRLNFIGLVKELISQDIDNMIVKAADDIVMEEVNKQKSEVI